MFTRRAKVHANDLERQVASRILRLLTHSRLLQRKQQWSALMTLLIPLTQHEVGIKRQPLNYVERALLNRTLASYGYLSKRRPNLAIAA